MEKPNPGSDAAIKQNCSCPVLDNSHGAGAYKDADGKPLFWINEDCPIHGNRDRMRDKVTG